MLNILVVPGLSVYRISVYLRTLEHARSLDLHGRTTAVLSELSIPLESACLDLAEENAAQLTSHDVACQVFGV